MAGRNKSDDATPHIWIGWIQANNLESPPRAEEHLCSEQRRRVAKPSYSFRDGGLTTTSAHCTRKNNYQIGLLQTAPLIAWCHFTHSIVLTCVIARRTAQCRGRILWTPLGRYPDILALYAPPLAFFYANSLGNQCFPVGCVLFIMSVYTFTCSPAYLPLFHPISLVHRLNSFPEFPS